LGEGLKTTFGCCSWTPSFYNFDGRENDHLDNPPLPTIGTDANHEVKEKAHSEHIFCRLPEHHPFPSHHTGLSQHGKMMTA